MTISIDHATDSITPSTGALAVPGKIIGGISNTATGDKSVVCGGKSHTASGNYSSVCGGLTNTASGLRSAVCGGSINTASGDYAFVGGGTGNSVNGKWSSIVGGASNTASGYYAFIGGGYTNTASGVYAGVIGGYGNEASGSYSTASGYNNTSSGDYSVASGIGALADKQLQHSIGASSYAATGDAQTSVLVARTAVTHSDANWHDILLAGTGRINMLVNDTTWGFRILITGSTSGAAKSWVFEITGGVKNDAGTVSILAQTVTNVYRSDTDFDAQVAVDGADTDAFLIQVKDSTSGGDVVRWVARIELVEVTYA